MAKKPYILTPENYYDKESNKRYCSVSQYKSFIGCGAYSGCEFKALAEINGDYVRDVSEALLIGSYVDCALTEPDKLEQFIEEHPEMIAKTGANKGNLKKDFVKADFMIARAKRDPFFMKTLEGETQVIMTGEIEGVPFKIKMDSYKEGKFICDLKTCESITKGYYNTMTGTRDNFIGYYDYITQGAIYQEIVRQNTGKVLPFFISAISKENEPDLEVIQIDNQTLAEALEVVKLNVPQIEALKSGELEPIRCGRCDWCKRNKVLKNPISHLEIGGEL